MKKNNAKESLKRQLVPISEKELETAFGTGCICPSGKRGYYNRFCCQHDCWKFPNKGTKFITGAS